MSVTPLIRTYTDQRTPQPDLTRHQIYDNDDVQKNGVPKSLKRFNEARIFDRTKLPDLSQSLPSPHAVTGEMGTPNFLRNKGWILPSDETIRRALANVPQSVAKALAAQSPDSPMRRLLGGRFQTKPPDKKCLEPHGFGFGVEIPKKKVVPPLPTRSRKQELWEPRQIQRLELTKRINQQMCAVLERHRHNLVERSRRVRVATESALTNVRLRTLEIETVGEKVKKKNLDDACKALGLPLTIEDPEALLKKLGIRKRPEQPEPSKAGKRIFARDGNKTPASGARKLSRDTGRSQQSGHSKTTKSGRLLPHQYQSIAIVKEFTVICSPIVQKEFEVIGSKSKTDTDTGRREPKQRVEEKEEETASKSDDAQSCDILFMTIAGDGREISLFDGTSQPPPSDSCPESLHDSPAVMSDGCPLSSLSDSCDCPIGDEPTRAEKVHPATLSLASNPRLDSSSNVDSQTFISAEDLISDMPSDVSTIRAYVEASGLYDENGTTRFWEDAKAAGEVKVTEEDRTTGAVHVAEEPRATEEVKVTEEARTTGAVHVAEEPRATEEVKVTEEARTTGAVHVAEEPRATEEVKVTEEARTTGAVHVTEEPRATEEVNVTEEARPSEGARPHRISDEEDTRGEPSLGREGEDN